MILELFLQPAEETKANTVKASNM